MTNLFADGLLSLLAYLAISHTHPKSCNKPFVAIDRYSCNRRQIFCKPLVYIVHRLVFGSPWMTHMLKHTNEHHCVVHVPHTYTLYIAKGHNIHVILRHACSSTVLVNALGLQCNTISTNIILLFVVFTEAYYHMLFYCYEECLLLDMC